MPSQLRPSICAALACATLSVATLGLTAMPAFAGEPQPFTEAAFTAAEKAGQPILIDSYATWCDICNRQKPILDKLMEEPKYKNYVFLRVNFDTQKDVQRQFKAPVQSTLIVYHGDKEVARSVGETQPEWIEDLLSQGLGKGSGS